MKRRFGGNTPGNEGTTASQAVTNAARRRLGDPNARVPGKIGYPGGPSGRKVGMFANKVSGQGTGNSATVSAPGRGVLTAPGQKDKALPPGLAKKQ